VETPLDRQDGSQFKAPEAAGELVAVDIDGEFRWEPCVMVESMGERIVRHIDVGDRVFFAGKSAHARIATHNKIAPE
jgi:hypothetical protein